MTDLVKLETEITTDPLTLGYAGMTDAQVADSLNGLTRRARVTAREVKNVLMRQGTWATIVDKKNSTTLDAAHTVCVLAYELINDIERINLDLDDPDIQTQIAAMVTVGVVTQAQADAIIALADNLQSRAQELGIGNVRAGHVQVIRGN